MNARKKKKGGGLLLLACVRDCGLGEWFFVEFTDRAGNFYEKVACAQRSIQSSRMIPSSF